MAKKSTNDACIPSFNEAAYRARDDADTLRRAGEIMGDKGRVKAAQAELTKAMSAIKRVAGAPSPKPQPKGIGLGFAKGRR